MKSGFIKKELCFKDLTPEEYEQEKLKGNIIEMDLKYVVPEEFEDYKKIMEMGAKKHGADNWLDPDGNKSSFNDMHNSMFHHLAESYAQGLWANLRGDHESELDPLLHLICRAQMMYTRLQLNIKHKDDLEG